MAMTDLGPFWIPSPVAALGAGVPTLAFWNDLNAVNEAVAFVFRVPKTGTLNTAQFRLGTVSNLPDNGMKVSFQDLSGDFPDGVVDQFRDVTTGFTTNAWLSVGLITSDGTDTGVKRTVTAGDYMAVVVEFVNFTAGDNVGLNGISIGGNIYSAMPGGGQHYLAQRSTTSVWSVSTTFFPQFALQYSDGTYAYLGPTWYPISALNTATWNNASTPDERGLRFTVAAATRIAGMWFRGDNTAALDVVLYDSGGSALVTVSVDAGVDAATGGLNFLVPFPSTTLTAGATYRLVIKPTSVTDVTLYDFEVPSNAYLSAVEGGIGWYYTERTDAGAWTETTTKRPWMGLLIDGVDTGGGGSGPFSVMWGAIGSGLLLARAMVQYLAMAGPVLVPAAIPTYAAAALVEPVRRRPFLPATQSPAIGQADPTAPELCAILLDYPLRRRPHAHDTRSTEYGRADAPPPTVPDLTGMGQPDVTRRLRRAHGPDVQQVLMPPGAAPEWYPSAESPVRRRRFLTHEAFATPVARPDVPFDPAQGASILPQPPVRPRAISGLAARATVPPVGPPSSALTPPGVIAWTGLPNQPPAPHTRAQGQLAPAQNVSPLAQPLPPEGSWSPSAELPPRGLKRRPWLEAFAQNIDPLDTPAYLASFWISYYPPGPFPPRGLLAALQQWAAEAPPVIELQVVFGAWRPEAPVRLRAPLRLTGEAVAAPQDMTTLGDAYGCMTLSSVRVTSALLRAPVVTSAILATVVVTFATLDDLEVC